MLISHPNVQNIIYKPYSFFTQIRLKLDPNSGHFHIPGTLIYMRGNPRNQLSAGIFSREGSNSYLPANATVSKVFKFSLAVQSTKRPDHGNTCPSTGKAVGNAVPQAHGGSTASGSGDPGQGVATDLPAPSGRVP